MGISCGVALPVSYLYGYLPVRGLDRFRKPGEDANNAALAHAQFEFW
jgi:hypothetical protein